MRWILLPALLFTSCLEINETYFQEEPNINYHFDSRLAVYANEFKVEAQKRFIEVDLDGLTIAFDSLKKGKLGSYHPIQDCVVMNQNLKDHLVTYSPVVERVLFHELAHARLGYLGEFTHVDHETYGDHLMNGDVAITTTEYIKRRDQILDTLYMGHPEEN